MVKLKLIDFLGLVNFRFCEDVDDYNTKIVRIKYPDKDNMEFSNLYDKDRYFEYGVYDFGCDTKKRLIQTINPFILNCYVSSVDCNKDGNLEITITDEEDIDSLNLDEDDYEQENLSKSFKKVFVCSPLRGNMYENLIKARGYCREVAQEGNLPIAPHLYFTEFLDDNNETERDLGIELGLWLLAICDEIHVHNEDGISEGMKKEIEMAEKLDIPIIYSTIRPLSLE